MSWNHRPEIFDPMPAMPVRAIGRVHSPFREPAGTPIQPAFAGEHRGMIEIAPDLIPGLRDLEGFSRIWILYWFHRASPAKLQVIPFRDTVERGIFATRAPTRPNPIGLSSVRLLGIERNLLHVAEIDILDGTPVLDIKPYVPEYDHHEAPLCGWIDNAPDRPVVADNRFAATPSAP